MKNEKRFLFIKPKREYIMSNMTVAKTILEQLGGNKFRMMTGAKNLAGDENS